MSQRIDIERELDRWLADGGDVVPDRVVDAALRHVDSTNQRSAGFGRPWRSITMKLSPPIVAVLATVAVVVMLGALALGLSRPGQPAAVTASPTAPAVVATAAATTPSSTPTPSPTPSPSIPPTLGVGGADLTQTFHSPLFGYAMNYATGWNVTPGTVRWTGPDNSGSKSDRIQLTGTDTTIWGSSAALPAGQTFAKWAAAYHAYLAANMEAACDGGDPSTWQPIQIGSETGRRIDFCNASEAVIAVGSRIYDFGLGQDTFTSASHADPGTFEAMLKTVVFLPKAAK